MLPSPNLDFELPMHRLTPASHFKDAFVRQYIPPTAQAPLLSQANTPSSGSADQAAKWQHRGCHPGPGQSRLHSDREVTDVSGSGTMVRWEMTVLG